MYNILKQEDLHGNGEALFAGVLFLRKQKHVRTMKTNAAPAIGRVMAKIRPVLCLVLPANKSCV
jgi:hypothetical protein